ncbi:DUF4231 domain-containing protein [Streptomyces griseoluteus]|uniref:DUF4231 domain-containing protein n=1 Tax=Streptomyces griseoluteus TaxID=29306 RepID=UPI0034160F1E
MATSTSTVLSIDQGIIEWDSAIAQGKFVKRLAFLWMTAGNLAVASGIVAGNLFIDSSAGLGALNFWGNVGFLASLIASSIVWYRCRSDVIEGSVERLKLEAERNALQVAETTSPNTSSAFYFYRESVPGFRDDYRRSAEKYRGRHNLFQLTVIVGSILTSVSTTASAEQGVWSWLAVGLSAIVSISAGIIAYFKFRERSLNLQQTADAIDLEMQAYALRIRRYRDLPPDQAATLFAEEIERLREEQRKKELQLEQPPEATSQQRPPLSN